VRTNNHHKKIDTMSNHIPTALTLHKASRTLEISFDDLGSVSLSCEFLRVHSPSAEVRGHGQGQEILQTGMRTIEITAIEPVGNYAIRPVFSDGHDSGIYSWDFLHSLCTEHEQLWQTYLKRLEAAGFTHDAGRDTPMVKQGAGCASH
jgi:DUF971 family protein